MKYHFCKTSLPCLNCEIFKWCFFDRKMFLSMTSQCIMSCYILLVLCLITNLGLRSKVSVASYIKIGSKISFHKHLKSLLHCMFICQYDVQSIKKSATPETAVFVFKKRIFKLFDYFVIMVNYLSPFPVLDTHVLGAWLSSQDWLKP